MRTLSLQEKGKILAYKIIEIEPLLPKQEFQPLEQKISLQILYHLVNHGGTRAGKYVIYLDRIPKKNLLFVRNFNTERDEFVEQFDDPDWWINPGI